ncbi:MAG: DUF3618 domain-containing protein [Pontixanthobacter sp.]
MQLGIIFVGLITLALAFFMFQAAKKKMSTANLKPERTIETAERTPDAATCNQDDPDAIERDIEQTQREISATVDQLSDQPTPRKMLDTVLNKTELGDMDGNDIIDQAKRNPLPIVVIGSGLLWLISDKDAKPSALTPCNGKSFGGSDGSGGYSAEWDSQDRYHRGYVERMSSIEPTDGEDNVAYLGRQNRARANVLMLAQRHDEDEKIVP